MVAVLGEHPHAKNLISATGFSGHGAMESPAAGLALSECIALGRYETIDVSALSIRRFWEGKPIHETIVI